MPKMKTNRGAAKRFSKTAKGKVKFKRAKMRHILTKKNSNWQRKARAGATMCDADAKLVRNLIPYK
ncbi:MAG: 50S ribosomal protein L35 [Myxococcota bacterium]|nr:50S ribosomal protein L35 [Myxococcota bacterium]